MILDLPHIETCWVLVRETEQLDGYGSWCAASVLHTALSHVCKPQLSHDLCEVLLSSRFGESLVKHPFIVSEVEYEGDGSALSKPPRVNE